MLEMFQFTRLPAAGLRRVVLRGTNISRGPLAKSYGSQLGRYRFNGSRFQSTKAGASGFSQGEGSQSGGGQQGQKGKGEQQKKKSGVKALIQEYGYSALGVYLMLSCIDFPACFVVVHSFGADKVKQVQTDVMNYLKRITGLGHQKPAVVLDGGDSNANVVPEEERSFWESPLFTEAIVAYALHKSLIFIRVPITAAITPSVVKQLRRWGFNVGRQKLSTIAHQAKAKTTNAIVDKAHAAASSPKFGTRVSKKQKWTSWFF